MTDKVQKKISSLNLNSWNDNKQVSRYIDYHSNNRIQDPERVILDQIGSQIRGGKILELGIGTGRLVQRLTQISDDYIGIDYSQKMVDFCRQNYPGVRFYCQDARDLSFFESQKFSLVMFSHNGIDTVSNNDRYKIFSEVYKILENGGYFVFSSHNLEWLKHNPFMKHPPLIFPRPRLSRNPLKTAVQIYRSLKSFYELLKTTYLNQHNKKLEIYTDHWAIVNEPTYGYVFLMYYTTIANQIVQLKEYGFSNPVYAFDRQGMQINDLGNSESAWIYYCTRK